MSVCLTLSCDCGNTLSDLGISICCLSYVQVSAVQQELLQLRDDAAAAGHERRQLQQQISTLQRQRGEQGNTMQGLQQQLAQLQEQLAQDRETLATMLRRHQEREQQLQEVRRMWLGSVIQA